MNYRRITVCALKNLSGSVIIVIAKGVDVLMTLNRKLLRSTRKNLSFYITVSLLTALTIMLWVGAFSVAETLKCTYTDLFGKSRLEDACFTVSDDIPDDEASALEYLYAVTLEKQEYRNTTVGKTRLRVFADTEKTDLTQITEGTGIVF